ncbi:AP-3 complex subunit beta-2-like, partial [Diachasma alloeum]
VVVAESVVVIKKLLQTQPNEHKEIIVHMAKLMDFITVPQARASILWLLGEYSDRVPKIAPDVLRKMAKSFVNEKDIVKLQTLNLAVKLCLNNPEQTKLFCQYVFQLAKYDQNYDIRDRARFLRSFIFEENGNTDKKLPEHAKRIFFTPKPAPTLTSRVKGSQYQLGTLSHYLDMSCSGYKPLPDYPEVPPDPSVRDVAEPIPTQEPREKCHGRKDKKEKKIKEKAFYSDEESSPAESEESEGSSETSSSESSENSDSDSAESSSDGEKSEEKTQRKKNVKSETSESQSESEELDSEESGSSRSEPELKKPSVKIKNETVKEKAKNNLDLLLELDDIVPMTPMMTPSLGGFLTPMNFPIGNVNGIREVSATFIPVERTEIVNKITGKGLKVESRFTRSQHLVSSNLTSVELTFTNCGNHTINNIRVGNKNLSSGMSMHDFSTIPTLQPNMNCSSVLGVNFNDSMQPANFNIEFIIDDEIHSVPVSLKAPIGEIVRAVKLPENMFIAEKEKLKGMNEHCSKIKFSGTKKHLLQKIYQAANISLVLDECDIMRFAGRTVTSKSMTLITIKFLDSQELEVCINCEKMVIGSMLLNEIKSNLLQ